MGRLHNRAMLIGKKKAEYQSPCRQTATIFRLRLTSPILPATLARQGARICNAGHPESAFESH
jgi:hypothetical protein